MTATSSSNALDLSRLSPQVAEVVGPFFEKAAAAAGKHILSIAVVGSAATADYRPGVSDVNSVFVMDLIDTPFLEDLAKMGRRFGRKGIAAPVLLSPEYIGRSLDSFPIEFLEYKLSHVVVLGRDYFSDLRIEGEHLRLAAERELKGLILNLQRGYIRALGNQKELRAMLVSALNAALPAFRAVLFAKGLEVPLTKAETVAATVKMFSLSPIPLESALRLRDRSFKVSRDGLQNYFEMLVNDITQISLKIDRW